MRLATVVAMFMVQLLVEVALKKTLSATPGTRAGVQLEATLQLPGAGAAQVTAPRAPFQLGLVTTKLPLERSVAPPLPI